MFSLPGSLGGLSRAGGSLKSGYVGQSLGIQYCCHLFLLLENTLTKSSLGQTGFILAHNSSYRPLLGQAKAGT